MPFGGCLVHGPLKAVDEAVGQVRVTPRGGVLPWSFTLGEMIQLVRVVGGDLTLPRELKTMTGVRANVEPSPASRPGLSPADAFLIEPNTTAEMHYRGFVLQRARTVRALIEPLADSSPDPEVGAMARAWFERGIMLRDEPLREELGPRLAALVAGDTGEADLHRDVFRHARGAERGVEEGLRDLLPLLDKPAGLVTSTWRYMPGGRPMHWPVDLRDHVLKAGQTLGLPVFEPWRFVKAFGVTKAMAPNMTHYRKEVLLPLGEALVAFTVGFLGGTATSGASATHALALQR